MNHAHGRTEPESAETLAAMLEVMTQLVEAHRGLVELVAALQGDVLGLVEAREPGDLHEAARALRDEAGPAGQKTQRLIADAEALARRTSALRGHDGRPGAA